VLDSGQSTIAMQMDRTADLVRVEDQASLAQRTDAHHPLIQNSRQPLKQVMVRIGMTLAKLMVGPSPTIWNTTAKLTPLNLESWIVPHSQKPPALLSMSQELETGKFPLEPTTPAHYSLVTRTRDATLHADY